MKYFLLKSQLPLSLSRKQNWTVTCFIVKIQEWLAKILQFYVYSGWQIVSCHKDQDHFTQVFTYLCLGNAIIVFSFVVLLVQICFLLNFIFSFFSFLCNLMSTDLNPRHSTVPWSSSICRLCPSLYLYIFIATTTTTVPA